jgi:predicted O-linked N-acetylglucosamine transferase (SPINDLY family)
VNDLTELMTDAIAQHRAGNLAEARKRYKSILARDPRSPAALHLLATLEAQEGNLKTALRLFNAALDINPRWADTLADKGRVLTMLGRHEEALACYRDATAVDRRHPAALQNQGCTLLVLGRSAEALAVFDHMLRIEPNFAIALHNRAIALTDLQRYAEAVASCDRALAIQPDYAEALQSRGVALEYTYRHDLALANFTRAVELNRNLEYLLGSLVASQLYCHDFQCLEQNKNELTTRVRRKERVATPWVFLLASDCPADQFVCSRIFAADKCPSQPSQWKGEAYRHDKIRLAYLSSDFRAHPTSHLLAGLFEHHDRSQFETIAVSYGPDDRSNIRARVMRAFDRVIDAASMTDAEAAALLRRNEVDIAVDLNGFIQHNRLGILAHRPAPIQVNYLAYPGSIGVDYIDYILADRWIVPEADRKFYSEQVVYLPHCYQANDSKRYISPQTPSRAACGLPENGFVFCCFNGPHKLTPEIFDVWMRLLTLVPDSVLWLIKGNPAAADNLRREAKIRGVPAERLIFAERMELSDHLARHRLADLFLDTLPCNAHTTASDALWAGLPILTCSGRTFSGRVAGSLLNAIGLSELITDSLQQYEATALTIARNPDLLASLKAKLAQNRNTYPLFDTGRFARNIEAAFHAMWQRQRRGLKPASFAVTPSDP